MIHPTKNKGYPSDSVIASLKDKYKPGKRIHLIHMDDEQAPPDGTDGTVTCVDDAGTIHVKWDTGSSLGLIYGADKFQLL